MERMGLPYVVQGHGIDVSARLRDPKMVVAYRVYASAKAVLTRSELHRRRLIELGLPAEKVHVNHGGVKVPEAPRQRDPTSSKRLLAVGVMVPKKAPIVLLESFRLAAQRDPALTLDYIGGGPLFPAAAQFVRACGLEDRVRLHGIAPEAVKQQLLGECGVFVQHSMTDPETGDEEGLPAAIQEAMAAGMAVVSTRHAGIPEAVIEGETGLLVDEGDVQAMAEAFVLIGDRAGAMGRAGHAEAHAKHAWACERGRLRHWLFGAAA
jgi:glycosyltransferase involved in cell wall biosynthesis